MALLLINEVASIVWLRFTIPSWQPRVGRPVGETTEAIVIETTTLFSVSALITQIHNSCVCSQSNLGDYCFVWRWNRTKSSNEGNLCPDLGWTSELVIKSVTGIIQEICKSGDRNKTVLNVPFFLIVMWNFDLVIFHQATIKSGNYC